LCALWINVADADKRAAGSILINAGMDAAEVAAANDRYADVVSHD